MSTETKADLESALENLDPESVEVLNPKELRQVAAAADAVADAQDQVEAAVIAAHCAGYSWGKIAIALGVSRQSAHERYSGLTKTSHQVSVSALPPGTPASPGRCPDP